MDPSLLPKLSTFSLQMTVHVDPSNADKFLEALRPTVHAALERPELVYLELFQDPENPGRISWIENWKQTSEWLVTVQLQHEAYAPFFAATEPMFIKPREFKMLKRVGHPWIMQKLENLEFEKQ